MPSVRRPRVAHRRSNRCLRRVVVAVCVVLLGLAAANRSNAGAQDVSCEQVSYNEAIVMVCETTGDGGTGSASPTTTGTPDPNGTPDPTTTAAADDDSEDGDEDGEDADGEDDEDGDDAVGGNPYRDADLSIALSGGSSRRAGDPTPTPTPTPEPSATPEPTPTPSPSPISTPEATPTATEPGSTIDTDDPNSSTTVQVTAALLIGGASLALGVLRLRRSPGAS